jgi:hypothetical protein
MKVSTIFSLTGFCLPGIIGAQSLIPPGSSSTAIHCNEYFVSKPLRDLPAYKPTPGKKQEAADKRRRVYHPKNTNFHPGNDYTDPIRQTEQGSLTGNHAPIENFEGIDMYEYDPPDPNGAVDSNYYVETVNVEYAVYDKSGNTILSARDLGALWSGDPQDGDPVVLYDKFADRWLITEFQVSNTPYQFCVAVSKTSDPTGAFYVWKFSMGSTDPDYPKYAIWDDGYYITFQAFGAVNPLVPQEIAVLERNRMLEGSPSAAMILANLPTPPDFMGGNNSLFTAPKVLDCDASALPPYGTPDYMVYFENIASGCYSNSIVMYKLVTDTTLHTLAVSRADSFAVPTFNAYFSGGTLADISQPGDPNGVDALDGTFNFRVPYMKFTGYNSVVLSNTVNLGSSVAGIRWYELRQNDTTGVWSLYQDGTYGPNDGTSRWNGAICQDYDGDIALEFSVASSTVYPGIRYTGRLVTDPLGQMTLTEQTAMNGTYTLSGTGGRWGDYSELDIDPADGLTFWGTNEYGGNADNATQDNRIFSFKLATATGINEIQNETSLKVYQNNNFLVVKATGLPGNDQLAVDLFDITGRQLTTQRVNPAANMFETEINVSALPKGVYLVRIGRMNFQRVVKTFIN